MLFIDGRKIFGKFPGFLPPVPDYIYLLNTAPCLPTAFWHDMKLNSFEKSYFLHNTCKKRKLKFYFDVRFKTIFRKTRKRAQSYTQYTQQDSFSVTICTITCHDTNFDRFRSRIQSINLEIFAGVFRWMSRQWEICALSWKSGKFL